MQLLYHCECGQMVVLHDGDMSRINFGKLPKTILEASTKHKCRKKVS